MFLLLYAYSGLCLFSLDRCCFMPCEVFVHFPLSLIWSLMLGRTALKWWWHDMILWSQLIIRVNWCRFDACCRHCRPSPFWLGFKRHTIHSVIPRVCVWHTTDQVDPLNNLDTIHLREHLHLRDSSSMGCSSGPTRCYEHWLPWPSTPFSYIQPLQVLDSYNSKSDTAVTVDSHYTLSTRSTIFSVPTPTITITSAL